MIKEIQENIGKSQEYLKIKEFDNAELILLKNLKISDDSFETYFLLGAISGIKKKYTQAEEYLKKSISLNPSHINSIVNLAIILKKNNQTDNSIKYFKEVLKLEDNNVESLCGLAQIYQEIQNFKEAENYYKKALKINPSHHIANHGYGKLLLKLNRHIDGLKLIEKVSGIIKFKKNNFQII
jgi:tetratricopeptide (TPR) repeat protein